MHTFYCSFLTLPSLFGILGILSGGGGFSTSQTLDILPKTPLICCSITGNEEAWHHISYFSNMVPFYSVF